jgi:hypothetical protein
MGSSKNLNPLFLSALSGLSRLTEVLITAPFAVVLVVSFFSIPAVFEISLKLMLR